jgi:hypothetical protein
MGVMIVAGIALLVYGISQKAVDPSFKLFQGKPSPAASATDAAPGGFGETRIALPDGCSVVDMRPDGPRLYLRIGPAGGCERIIVVHAGSGQPLGSIWLRP